MESSKKIKVVIADDEVLFRKGISFLLNREANMEVVHEADDGANLLEFLKSDHALPDIILMDLKMPEINGVEATKQVRDQFPNVKIIALTSYNTKPFIINMVQLGACSFLKKNTPPQELIHTINEVSVKGFYYNTLIMDALHENLSAPIKKTLSQFDENYISKREKEVLELICKQYSTSEIAEKLFLSPRTVEGHRNNLLLKTESKNTAGLVVYAIQNQIIDTDHLKDHF